MQNIDEQIVRRAQGGDMRAFEEIYRLTSSYIYTLALKAANNVQDAQEITQDVFVKIHKNLYSFQYKSSFKTWIYRIAVNTSFNMLKKRSKEYSRRANNDNRIFETVLTADDKESKINKEDAAHKVNLLLDKLYPEQRIYLTLREINGLSYQEIAEALNTNLNTVRTKIKRAREALLKLAQGKQVIYGM